MQKKTTNTKPHRALGVRMQESAYHDGRRFISPGAPPMATWRRVLRWWFSHRKRGPWPEWVPTRPFQQLGNPCGQRFHVSWVNHSTFLLETPAGNILTDPVYSRRAGPFKFFGPRRVHAPGIPFDALPRIDFVLLSHDHYDNCDMSTLRKLARRDSPQGITPLANGRLLHSAGFREIVELDVWENTFLKNINGHGKSSRVSGRRCGRLWGGFWLEIAGRKIYFIGDTGYNKAMFLEIRRRLGVPDLAMIPICLWTLPSCLAHFSRERISHFPPSKCLPPRVASSPLLTPSACL